jgi:hypothetical protein
MTTATTTDATTTYLTLVELAERWRLSPATIATWRNRAADNLPRATKIGRRLLFRLDHVEAREQAAVEPDIPAVVPHTVSVPRPARGRPRKRAGGAS